jgi:hypothetical protein
MASVTMASAPASSAAVAVTPESKYQKTNPYNRFLPYADEIDQVFFLILFFFHFYINFLI